MISDNAAFLLKLTGTVLGERYIINSGNLKGRVVIPVDGEEMFRQPGVSHGFVHLLDSVTLELISFAGFYWFKDNASKV